MEATMFAEPFRYQVSGSHCVVLWFRNVQPSYSRREPAALAVTKARAPPSSSGYHLSPTGTLAPLPSPHLRAGLSAPDKATSPQFGSFRVTNLTESLPDGSSTGGVDLVNLIWSHLTTGSRSWAISQSTAIVVHCAKCAARIAIGCSI